MKPVRSSTAREGLPVNAVTGALMLAGDEELDFVVWGALQLPWQRTYSSTHAHVGWFGRGWSSPLEIGLEAVTDLEARRVEFIEHVGVTGRRVRFPALAPGGSADAPGDHMRLSRTAEGDYRLATGDGLTYSFSSDRGPRFRLVTVSDRNDNVIRLTQRDSGAQDLAETVVECCGGQRLTLRFTTDRLVQVDAVFEPGLPAVTLARYDYNPHGDLVTVFNAAGERKRQFGYDAGRLLNWQRYAESFESWTEYTGQGVQTRAATHRDNVGRAWTLAYHDEFTQVTDVDGRVSLYHLDARKRWIGYTDPLGQFTARGLDANGNVRSIVGPSEIVEETVYDEHGHPMEVRDAAGGVTTIAWDPALGLPLVITDALGQATTYVYDARGNLVVETNAAGVTTQYEYDDKGQVVAVIDGRGGRIALRYDDRGLPVEHVDCSGRKTAFTYDAGGRLVRITNALSQETALAYDAAGRLVRQTLADGSFEAYEVDMAGQMTAVIDAAGARTEYSFAPDGLLERRRDALGHDVAYQYDHGRRLIALVNENDARYRFSYDVLDRLIDETRFDGTRAIFSYNPAGHLVHSVEAPDTAQPIATVYRRDPSGRLLSRTTSDTALTFDYDALGNIVQARSEPDGSLLRFRYDQLRRLVEEVSQTATRSLVMTHAYDEIGSRVATTLSDGTQLKQLHYGGGHLHQISLDGIAITDIERDALHREVSRTQGRLSTLRSYDAVGRVLSMTSALDGGSGPAAGSPPSGIVLNRWFRYDATGRMVQAQDRDKSRFWEYDSIDRLTRFDDQRFAFDPAHNMVDPGQGASGSQGRVVDNRIRVYEDKRFEYDAHGRVIEKKIGAHTVMRFDWDGEHRLRSATVIDARGERTTRYAYDAFARRTCKRSDDEETVFLWNGDDLLRSYDARAETTFICEPGRHVPLALVVRGVDDLDAPRACYHYHCDPSGLPQALTDSEGQVAWNGRYTAWGRLAEDDRPVGHALVDQPFRLQGQYCDDETGWHYNRYRYYDPDIGRFVTPDPLGLTGGVSPYQYGPNPVGWIDPLGLTRTPAQCAADKALADGKESGAACQVEIGSDVVITGVSGNPGKLMPKLRRILDRVPIALRSTWHGNCAEIACINTAMQRGLDLTGAKSSAVNIGAALPGQQHGRPKPTCSTCREVLRQLDMIDGGPPQPPPQT